MSKIIGNKIIESNNLSIAWAKAFLRLFDHESREVLLSVSIGKIEGGQIKEDETIRNLLSEELLAKKEFEIGTVANTIFPISLWNPNKPRQDLYLRYSKCWSKIKKCRQNNLGTYFQRMINYRKNVNQLEHIINTWHKGNHRHSALQLGILDPSIDHTNQRVKGFPCLHQVSITPLGTNGINGFVITGFYATQYIFEKAYGNYLGLFRLGKFISNELGIELKQVNCIAGLANLGGSSKESLGNFRNKLMDTNLVSPQITLKL